MASKRCGLQQPPPLRPIRAVARRVGLPGTSCENRPGLRLHVEPPKTGSANDKAADPAGKLRLSSQRCFGRPIPIPTFFVGSMDCAAFSEKLPSPTDKTDESGVLAVLSVGFWCFSVFSMLCRAASAPGANPRPGRAMRQGAITLQPPSCSPATRWPAPDC